MWRTVKLGDVCELAYGKALDAEDRSDIGGYPAFGANGVKTQSKKYLYNKPSIVIGRKGSAGELNKVNEAFWALDVTYYTKTDDKVLNLDYLYYVLSTLNLPSLARGIKPGINRNDVYEQTIKLPPLAEQQRIVAKLDAAFAEIDRAIEIAEAKEDEVGKLKASLLSSMIVTDSGSSVNLKAVCTIDWGNTSLTKKSYEENGEFLAVSATGADGKISFYEHEADVCVLSAIGAQCGKMFFPQERFTAIKNTITLTPKHEVVDGKYLYYMFTHIELPRRGAAQPFIAKGDIEKFQVPLLPSLEEQRRIVNKLDGGFEAAADALALVSQSKNNFVSLKSAILTQELQPSEAA